MFIAIEIDIRFSNDPPSDLSDLGFSLFREFPRLEPRPVGLVNAAFEMRNDPLDTEVDYVSLDSGIVVVPAPAFSLTSGLKAQSLLLFPAPSVVPNSVSYFHSLHRQLVIGLDKEVLEGIICLCAQRRYVATWMIVEGTCCHGQKC